MCLDIFNHHWMTPSKLTELKLKCNLNIKMSCQYKQGNMTNYWSHRLCYAATWTRVLWLWPNTVDPGVDPVTFHATSRYSFHMMAKLIIIQLSNYFPILIFLTSKLWTSLKRFNWFWLTFRWLVWYFTNKWTPYVLEDFFSRTIQLYKNCTFLVISCERDNFKKSIVNSTHNCATLRDWLI